VYLALCRLAAHDVEDGGQQDGHLAGRDFIATVKVDRERSSPEADEGVMRSILCEGLREQVGDVAHDVDVLDHEVDEDVPR
jgi:hypothetical protein